MPRKLPDKKNIEWTDKQLEQLGPSLRSAVTAPKKKYPIDQCAECGKKYHQHRKSQRFCSNKCRFANRDSRRWMEYKEMRGKI
jgi:endogenous inhibitor of DNA gyrase (YacG/DUF329 family)